MSDDTNGFDEYRRLFLDAIQGLRADVKELREEVGSLRIAVTSISVRQNLSSSIWGAIGGAIISAIVTLIITALRN